MTTTKTALQTGVTTRRGAIALAAALAAGTRIRPVAAQSSGGVWIEDGNAARTGVFPGPGLDLTQEITRIWGIEGRFVSACGVCDGIAYYMPILYNRGDPFGQVAAVNARTGEELWIHEPPVTDPASYFGGGIAIADGLLVASTGPMLVGLDAKTGEGRWIFDLQGGIGRPSPVIVDGVLYLSDLVSVNAITLGDTPGWLWKTPLGDGETSVVDNFVSVDGDYVVVTSRRPDIEAGSDLKTIDLHVLNRADGAELYRYELPAGGDAFRVAVQNGMLFSLASGEDYKRKFVFALAIDGTEQWRIELPEVGDAIFAYPVVAGDLVICSAGDRLLGLNAATGETVWSSARLEPLSPSMVLIDDVIYIGAYSLTSAQTIYAISAKDGSIVKSIASGSERSNVIGITDGVLITDLGTRGGQMTAFSASASGRA